MLPSLHAVQNALLPLRRQAAEVLQPLPQPLLPLLREAAKLGIIFQRLLLLLRRKIFVLAQPLTRVVSLRLVLWVRRALCALFCAIVAAVLWPPPRCGSEHERPTGPCHTAPEGLHTEHRVPILTVGTFASPGSFFPRS